MYSPTPHIIHGIGHFLPFKKTDVLPALFVKLKNGEYPSGKAVNYGTNQYDIKPTIFLYKQMGRFSIDAAVKYYFRLENPTTKISPGNELYLQVLPGIQITKILKAGPSINWMRSSSQRNHGDKVDRSERESLSIGGDVYLRLPIAGVTFTYLNDIQAKNTTRGHFFQIKTTCKF
jgi:hypothetical protein